MTPDRYCQEKAAGSGSSFYYSFLYLTPEKRRAITALYAFCREVDDVVDECRDPDLARIKLQWWREDVQKIYQGTPEHPVNQALQPACEQFTLPAEHFQEIIDGMQMDLDYTRYPSFRDLALYCHRVAGVVGLMSAEIFGYHDRSTLKYANDLGIAFQLTNILRDVREDAMRDRIYIPLDELEKFGVLQDDILRGRCTTPRLIELFSYQADRAKEYYQRAFSHLSERDRYAQQSGIIMAAIYRSLLDEIENDGFRILEHRVKLTPLRKFWIAFMTSRHEKRRHRRNLAR
jgi:phytoene synthase